VLGLFAHCGQLSVVARSFYHHYRRCLERWRHLLVPADTTHTLNVPSLTGAVMCMGVARPSEFDSAGFSFSRDRMNAGVPALQAALEAGYTRMRPVIMTALAMIIGMVPMALGFGEGGEQNAPLGRAVIGGLLFATVATLFFVPSVFSIIHGRREARLRAEQR